MTHETNGGFESALLKKIGKKLGGGRDYRNSPSSYSLQNVSSVCHNWFIYQEYYRVFYHQKTCRLKKMIQ